MFKSIFLIANLAPCVYIAAFRGID